MPSNFYQGFSTLEMFASENTSKPIPLDFLVMPISKSTESLDKHKKEMRMEQEQEEEKSRIPTTSSSSSSCSSQEHGGNDVETKREVVQAVFAATGKQKDDEEEEDKGYQTPTSPARRIPASLICPPAPKKPPAKLRAKRKARRRRLVGQCLFDISEFVVSAELAGHRPKAKKAKQ